MAIAEKEEQPHYAIESFVRGVHAYKEHWKTDQIGCVLKLKRANQQPRKHSVAVMKTTGNEDIIVGHVPYNIAPLLSAFLSRDCNNGSVKITGKRFNGGAGYGVEVPCVYCCTDQSPT